jgi:hypothetical protein
VHGLGRTVHEGVGDRKCIQNSVRKLGRILLGR